MPDITLREGESLTRDQAFNVVLEYGMELKWSFSKFTNSGSVNMFSSVDGGYHWDARGPAKTVAEREALLIKACTDYVKWVAAGEPMRIWKA